jgi:hypothetical protein
MPVVESIAPADALAARRALRAQIARLEGELATILASTYPPIAPPTVRAGATSRPHLLDLSELECVRDDLAGRVTAAHHALERQSARQSQARALLLDMLENPPAHKGAYIRNADLGLPGCTSYRVLPRLGPVGVLTGWWRVKVSSGCPLPSAAKVSRRNRKRRPRPRSTAPAVPPRPPKRTRPRLEERPKAPWHPVPLVEIAVFAGLVLIVVGLITSDSRRGRTLLLLGLALGSLGGLDTTMREHFAGYRSHTLVLALAPTVAIAVVLAVAGAPVPFVLVLAVAVFGAALMLLRGAWRRASA